MTQSFRVGLTRDFLKPNGSPGFGEIGLNLLDEDPRVEWEFLSGHHDVIPREIADEYDALLVLAPRVSAESLDGCRRLSLVARFGVGYDNVDVAACSRNNVLLTITPDGVRRPVAVSVMTFLLALSHRLLIKDRLTRAGRWAEKLDYCGTGLTGRTLGLIGFGNIGRETARLAMAFDLRVTVSDPFTTDESARAAGVIRQDLETLLSTADFVCVCCSLTPETHHLLDARRLALMKPSAFLINVARGPIIDQAALTQALTDRRIAGAGLDVFEHEPIAADDPLLALDNVIVAPHALCWTDELFLGNGQAACRSILDVAHGRLPTGIVNREAVELPGVISKLAEMQSR